MGSESRSKLNLLLNKWPKGTVATLTWLKSLGVYQQLAHKYKESNWIENLAPGAFKRYDDKIYWDGAIFALQNQLNLPIHVAGLTAITLHGRAQYLPIGKRPTIYLIGQRGITIPEWFKNCDWQAIIKVSLKSSFPSSLKFQNELKINGDFKIGISCSELAILEHIDKVDSEESFLSTRELMEGMVDLKTGLVQELLELYPSIKVKRVFLFLAENLDLPWISKINLKKINLGKGKRSIVPGGVFDSKYNITIPKSLMLPEESIF